MGLIQVFKIFQNFLRNNYIDVQTVCGNPYISQHQIWGFCQAWCTLSDFVALVLFISQNTESYPAPLGLTIRLILKLIPRPLSFQLLQQESRKKRRDHWEMRLADTHHKTDLQLSVTKRRVSCVQNLTYFTHSPRLLSSWQHWPWKQWKKRLPKRFFTCCCKDISTENSKTQSKK